MQPDNEGRLYSREMQLALQEIKGTLRLINPRTGEILKTYTESEEARAGAEEQVREAEEQVREAEIRAAQEHQARLAAEAEAARLRAELEKLRKQD